MVLVRPEDYSNESPDNSFISYKMKTPKRILHFSDGILEEYSTDEEDNAISPPSQEITDPSTLTWGPWMLFKMWAASASTLSFIDYLGESLASLFGITTPRYYFELEEYKRRQANAVKQAEKEKGWCNDKHEIIDVPLKTMTSASAQPKIEAV